jgi:transcriptional regulator with GAF, ATPase, and Fis domain
MAYSSKKENSIPVNGLVYGDMEAELLLELEERDMLLSFNREITVIRDRKELLRKVYPRLQQLFQVEDLCIGLMDDKARALDVSLRISSGARRLQARYRTLLDQPLSDADTFIKEALDAGSPRIESLVSVDVNDTASLMVTVSLKAGLKECLTAPLQKGNDRLGLLMLWSEGTDHFTSRHLRLMAAMADQISLAVSNIMAYEQIEAQLAEIERYKEQLEEERSYLQQEVGRGYTYQDIVGVGPAMQQVFDQLTKVSDVNSTVLILGETGTGKELVARALHHVSPRADKLMVKVNCATLPANLVESELFGHEKGSFTGATERRIGKFELAHGGTLFLDEIGELQPELQVKLLRALQEREIERIGGKSPIKIDVRVIAATNRNLEEEVAAGRFRNDLYYRLHVFPVTLPPLRGRMEDLPALATHFLEKYARITGQSVKSLSAKALKELMAYRWPGNVRELEHIIERSILMSPGQLIRQVFLPSAKEIKKAGLPAEEELKSHADNERDHILKVLNHCRGKIYGSGGAAAILGLPVSTLNSKIKKLGIAKSKLFNYKP